MEIVCFKKGIFICFIVLSVLRLIFCLQNYTIMMFLTMDDRAKKWIFVLFSLLLENRHRQKRTIL